MSELLTGICFGLFFATSWPQELGSMFDDHFILPKAEWNCFEHTNGQCTAYNYKGGLE